MTRKVLPSHLVPIHYDLTIYPDIIKHKFYGIVTLKLKANGPIHLNAKELDILSVKVNDKSYKHSVDTENESIVIDGDFKDVNIVVVEYTGTHNDKMAGFYRSKVELPTNETTHIVVTQFEPTDCRKCLPCIDEPNKKATFQITIICPESLTALSNTSVTKSSPITIDNSVKSHVHIQDTPYKQVQFNVTPVMSTYLLAMAVGDLDYIESTSIPGAGLKAIPVKCYGPRVTKVGNIQQSKFALQVCCDALPILAKYFALPYPIDKLDLLAVPDFSAGAMENFGLITFRSILLYITSKSSLQHQQQCAYVVNHELSHQWFGNSTTFDWWEELWLNEGFATLIGWKVTHDLFPKWQIWDKFIANDYSSALSLDALVNTHPVFVKCDDPNDIGQIFDAISYSKGASLIKMLYDYHPTEFIQGVAEYLEFYKFKNATTSDLWRHLAATMKMDVVGLMNKWITIPGYPYLRVQGHKIKQSRFLLNGAVEDQTWPIPLGQITFNVLKDGIYASDAPLLSQLLSTTEMDFSLKPTNKLICKWSGAYNGPTTITLFNYNQSALVRVLYDDYVPLLSLIKFQIQNKFEIVPVVNRLGLLNDLYHFGVNGTITIVQYLEALHFYQGERDYYVLSDIAKNTLHLLDIFTDKDVKSKINTVLVNIFGPLAKELTFKYGNDDFDLLRTLSIKTAGLAGNQWVIEQASTLFNGDLNEINANIGSAVFQMILKNGVKADYFKLKEYYINNKEMDKKLSTLGVLGYVQDKELIQDVLNMVFSDLVRPQDLIYILQGLGNNEASRVETWVFIKENWDRFSGLLEGSLNMLGNIVSRSCCLFTEESVATEMIGFFKNKKEWKQINKSVEQTVEKIKNNAGWVKRDLVKVTEWAKK